MPIKLLELLRAELAPVTCRFTRGDTFLYALGVGVGAQSPLDPSDLKYLRCAELVALPTMATTLGARNRPVRTFPGCEGQAVLHAEQSLVMSCALPASGVVVCRDVIEGAYETGPGSDAIVRTRTSIVFACSETPLASMQASLLVRGGGGFGGERARMSTPLPPAGRPPDLAVERFISHDQALIHCLSGDDNPIHWDPAAARAHGFERPILHGLSIFGTVARALIGILCDDSPARMTAMSCRFINVTYPGEWIRLEVWTQGRGRLLFRVIAISRGCSVLSCGNFLYR